MISHCLNHAMPLAHTLCITAFHWLGVSTKTKLCRKHHLHTLADFGWIEKGLQVWHTDVRHSKTMYWRRAPELLPGKRSIVLTVFLEIFYFCPFPCIFSEKTNNKFDSFTYNLSKFVFKQHKIVYITTTALSNSPLQGKPGAINLPGVCFAQ